MINENFCTGFALLLRPDGHSILELDSPVITVKMLEKRM